MVSHLKQNRNTCSHWTAIHQNLFWNTLRLPKHQNIFFIFNSFPWSVLVLTWMAPNAWKYCRSLGVWGEKMLKPWEKQKKDVNLQTYSHGHCDMSSSLQVSGPRGTSCWPGRRWSNTALSGAWPQLHRWQSTVGHKTEIPALSQGFMGSRRKNTDRWFPLYQETAAKDFNPVKCSNTGLILIKWVVPSVINPFLIITDYFKTTILCSMFAHFARWGSWLKGTMCSSEIAYFLY